MTIAEVSKQTGLTQDTLRYYERIGLLPKVSRNKSGNRDYAEGDIRWVEFIKCMRGAGVSVEGLIEYVALHQQGDSTIHARKKILIEQRGQLAAKIEDIQRMLDRLDGKIDRYEHWAAPMGQKPRTTP